MRLELRLACLVAFAIQPWGAAVRAQSTQDTFTVGDIRIEGLQRISEGTVFNYLPVNIGDHLDGQRIGEAMRALLRAAEADAGFTLARSTLDEVIAKQTTFPDAVAGGKIKFTGNPIKLGELMALMDEFPRMFEIVEPKRTAAS